MRRLITNGTIDNPWLTATVQITNNNNFIFPINIVFNKVFHFVYFLLFQNGSGHWSRTKTLVHYIGSVHSRFFLITAIQTVLTSPRPFKIKTLYYLLHKNNGKLKDKYNILIWTETRPGINKQIKRDNKMYSVELDSCPTVFNLFVVMFFLGKLPCSILHLKQQSAYKSMHLETI